MPRHRHSFAPSVPVQFHRYSLVVSLPSTQLPPAHASLAVPHAPFSSGLSDLLRNTPAVHRSTSVSAQSPGLGGVSSVSSTVPGRQEFSLEPHTGS